MYSHPCNSAVSSVWEKLFIGLALKFHTYETRVPPLRNNKDSPSNLLLTTIGQVGYVVRDNDSCSTKLGCLYQYLLPLLLFKAKLGSAIPM